MSKLEVDTIAPQSGTTVTLGESGDTVTVPTGVTFDTSNSTVTLPDGTVTNAKVNASAAIDYSKLNLTGNIALADLSATGTKDATTFLRGDNTFGVPPLGGITEADQWRLTANTSSAFNGDLTTNWERNDSTGATYIGTGLSQSSGIFSFPSTGKYLINFQMAAEVHGGDTNVEILLNVTIDNSNYSTAYYGLTGNGGSADGVRSTVAGSHIFDVTNISNCKFKFTTSGLQSTTKILGDTSVGLSGFWVIRLGDT